MNKKAVIGLSVVGALLIGGNIGKNIYVAGKIDNAIQSEISKNANNNKIKYSDVSCSGVSTIDCSLNEVVFSEGTSGSVSMDKLTIYDIAQLEKFQNIDFNNENELEQFLVKTFTEGASYKIDIENLKINDDSEPGKELIRTIKNELAREIKHDPKFQKEIQNNADLLVNGGVDMTGVVSINDGAIHLEYNGETELAGAKVSADLEFDHTSISSIRDIERAFKDVIYKNITIILEDKVELAHKLAYIAFTDEVNKSKWNRDARRNVQQLTNILGIEGNLSKVTYDQFKQSFKGESFKKKIEELKSMAKNGFPKNLGEDEKILLTLIDDISNKVNSIASGADNEIELTISSQLSQNIFQKEMRNIFMGTKTTKPLSELIQVEVN